MTSGTSVKGTGFGYNAAGHVGDNQTASDTQSHSYVFDGNGNPTTWKSAALTFDPENRMTAYGTSLTAGYMGDSLRAWKQDSLGNRTYFVYDGTNVIGELNATGNLGVVYTWGANGLLSRHTSSTGTLYYTYDPTGSVATVTNSSAAVQGDEVFDATGKRLNSYSTRPVSFCGQWGYYDDAETGLILCGHRYYDSFAARFLNRDSIGFAGGVNLYGYCKNNTISSVDPFGFCCIPEDPNLAALAGGIVAGAILVVLGLLISQMTFLGPWGIAIAWCIAGAIATWYYQLTYDTLECVSIPQWRKDEQTAIISGCAMGIPTDVVIGILKYYPMT